MLYKIGAARALVLVLAALVVVLWFLYESLTPPVEMTRFRNSLLASVGTSSDFDWGPDNIPNEFNYESKAPPAVFVAIGEELRFGSTNELDLMSTLVEHLRSQPKKPGPIQSTTTFAYQEIIRTGRGYCADYTQVFNGLAHSTELTVREWGMSFDRFSGDGHTFSEIYDDRARRWVFVDPVRGFYVRDVSADIPLSALEFRQRLRMVGGFHLVKIVPIGDTFRFGSASEAFDYYVKGADQFYLWFGNDVFSYDDHPAVRLVGPLSRSLEQLAAIIVGIHPKIRILRTETNQAEISALLRLKYLVLSAAVVAVLLSLFATWQISLRYKAFRSKRGR